MTRREFIGVAAMTAAATGCATKSRGLMNGTAMTNFAVAPMDVIRIGYIGIGERGT